ncbi:MAG: hypothetical protein FIB01_16385 [Gemmatimonadetes bacterium]|nr:hypothetical protein [Gemmatimonadota bacterium]
MHDRYAATWYETLRFRQKVLRTQPDGSPAPEQVWLEHMRVPGALRIDMAADYNGNAVLYAGDSTYVLRSGQIARRAKGGNILLVLGFDLYRQPVAQTLERLQAEGIDLTVMHAATWQGRSAYVIGAPPGDSTRAQFWVDAERLVFVRLIQPAGQALSETRFDEYRPLAGGWISPLVVFRRDGREIQREVYYDIEANPVLPEGLLDPARWHEVRPR